MDEGKHYSFLPTSMISIFRDHVAPPDFAENTDMAEDLDYIDGSGFCGGGGEGGGGIPVL